MHDWAQFYCHHHREHFFSNNYISAFNFPIELLHMQLVPEHFIHTSHWIILAKSAGNNALPLCQSWIQRGKRNERQLPVSWRGLRLHLETELRGQVEVLAENTERNWDRRETKRHIAGTVKETITCFWIYLGPGSRGSFTLLELPLEKFFFACVLKFYIKLSLYSGWSHVLMLKIRF